MIITLGFEAVLRHRLFLFLKEVDLMRALGFVAIVLAVFSTSVRAEVVDEAAATGSERLAYYASTFDVQTSGDVSALRNFVMLSSKIGFNALDKTKKLHGSRVTPLSLTPILKFDDNINGGNKSDQIVFSNGLTLNFPEDSLAKGDVLAGFQLSSGARMFYSRGRYLDINAGVGKSWGIQTHLSQLNWNASACSRNHVAGWSFVDLCATHTGKQKSLGESRENRVEMMFTQLTKISDLPWEIRAKAFRQDSSGAWNNGAGIQMLGVLNAGTSVDVSIESEFETTANRYQAYDAAARVNFKIAGKKVSLKVGQSLMANSKLLGQTFDVTSNSLVASIPVGKLGVANLSVEKSTSAISLYDTTTVGLSMDISGIALSKFLR